MKTLTLLVCTLLAEALGDATPTHILTVTLGPTQSHKVPFVALGQGLKSRGHKVTLVSAFPPAQQPVVREVYPKEVVEAVAASFGHLELVTQRYQGEQPFSIWDMIDYARKVCAAFYDSTSIHQLLTERVDLLIIDGAFSDCALGLSHHFHTPVILLNSIAHNSKPLPLTGSPVMYSVTPVHDSNFADRMDFHDRSLNGIRHLLHDSASWLVNKLFIEPLVRQHVGSDAPSISSLARNVSMVFQNGHHTVTHPRPFLPSVVEIACIHCRNAKPLPKDLEAFISGGNRKGFVFVSFGTSVQTSQFPIELRRLMLKAFSRLPYQVLWKFEWQGDKESNWPKNVRLSSWVPQQDLLGHPQILAFVNHGGLLGVLESVYHAVPMVVMPVFCDHGTNSRKPMDDGYALVLDLNNLTQNKLFSSIVEVIDDQRFRSNVQHRSELLRDQPEPPLDRALYWVEYVLRHRGAPHLHSAAKDLSLIQYFMLDTLGALVAALYVTFVLLKSIYRLLFKKIKTTKKVKRT